MQLDKPLTAREVADLIGSDTVIGDADRLVTGLEEIHKVYEGSLTFVDVKKYFKKAFNSAATTVIVNEEVEAPDGKTLILSDDPFRDYNALVDKFRYKETDIPQDQYYRGHNVSIGENTVIYPGCYIADNVTIGSNCVLHPNTVVYHGVTIGNNVIIHANSTIGSDGLYFKTRPDGSRDKMLTAGTVIVEDNVEMGSGCTIDKGVSGKTIIGAGTKFDNQVHIGHGVEIGKNCLIVAACIIGGKTIIEDDVMVWGGSAVDKSLRVGKGAIVYSTSSAVKSVPAGAVVSGYPARPHRQQLKQQAALAELTDNLPQLRKLLKNAANDE